MERWGNVDITYFIFSKAFKSVSSCLLVKMKNLRISKKILNIIRFFNR